MDSKEKYERCVEELKHFANDAGFTEVVIGLSGGLDSAVTALMCVDAFKAEAVHAVLLPGPYSSDHSINDAEELAENLGISTQTISIVKPYEAFEEALADASGGQLAGLAAENTQARCRMVCLMALSNTHKWLLINTGNKSEAMTGYSTLYGDTAGAFAPLGGLYKTDVYAVGRWRSEQEDRPLVPENIFAKPPSAELAPGQEDEKNLGIEYALLDKILIEYVEYQKSPAELVAAGFAEKDVLGVIARIEGSEFKRKLEPPYPQALFY